ncbi:Ubiquitin-conjugating enzyme E2 U [Galemys pyrenaicus]|uniref:Ubiquitin-conjugating enzyme E2 U n=1 Tax=Galemys pyrenaicus TaxID=202257 RepID=A0A8J5ZVW4_GALPY|nr:Ubiquitin-conjugating enzyme E2 U [Galemys pyrenaicus]
MEWEADIEGLQDTIWQGLFFHLKINFTLKYNLVPPTVKFTTIPFHPNVDQHTGQPCIDFLNNPNEWNPRYTLSSILLTLQVMLSNPVLENPVNLEAAKLFTKDESKYRLTVLRLFQEPLQCKKNLLVFCRSTKTISFYDYYKSWCEIATSKVTGSPRTTLYFSPQSQSETEIVTNIYESDANWKSEELIDFDESWEEEVDDLVAWTNTLDIGRLQE